MHMFTNNGVNVISRDIPSEVAVVNKGDGAGEGKLVGGQGFISRICRYTMAQVNMPCA